MAATRSRVPRSGATFAVVALQAGQVSLIGSDDFGVGLGVESEALIFVSAWVVDALEGRGAGTRVVSRAILALIVVIDIDAGGFARGCDAGESSGAEGIGRAGIFLENSSSQRITSASGSDAEESHAGLLAYVTSAKGVGSALFTVVAVAASTDPGDACASGEIAISSLYATFSEGAVSTEGGTSALAVVTAGGGEDATTGGRGGVDEGIGL